MADRRQLAQGLMMMTPAMREDLAGREQDIQRGKTVELLRRAGKEMYENPIVNTAISLSPGAGDLQSGYEAYNSAREGNYGESALNALGVLPFIPSMGFLGKTVWHGSPKVFDEFNLNLAKEGGSRGAYGEGLYFSESPKVANKYRSAGGEGGSFGLEPGPTQGIANLLAYKGEQGEELARKYYPKLENIDEHIAKAKQAVNENSALYKVELPDEQIAKMLIYGKPLSHQSPEVQAAIKNSPYAEALSKNDAWHGEEPTADQIYFRLSDLTSPKEASKYFASQGVPGIQYLDQASRGTGEGTRNYVVFSDEIPQILERNGTPLGNAVRNFEAPQAQALREAEEYGQKMLGLPPGNTPMDRAIAGGYVDPTYHGTKTDVPEFDLSYHGTATDPGDFGEALYSSANPNIAGNYAESTMRGATTEGANIMPLMTRRGNQMQVEGMKGMEPLLEKAGGIENWFDLNPQQQAQIAKDMGYTSVRDFGYPQTANYDLGDVRSKFAAFDPRYFGKPGLMLGAGGLGVYGALQGEDEYK